MKRALAVILMLAGSGMAQEPAAMLSADAARTQYEMALKTSQEKFLQDVKAAQVECLAKLEEILKAEIARGDLDRVLIVKDEMKRVEDYDPVPRGLVSAIIQQPRALFEAKLSTARTTHDKLAKAAHSEYLAGLDAVVKDETKAGRLDAAIAARDLRRSVEKLLPPSAVLPTKAVAVADPMVVPPVPEPKPAEPVAPTPRVGRLLPGLLVQQYAAIDSHSDKNPVADPSRFTAPVAQPFAIPSLKWRYDPKLNAVATGFLKIEKDGDYVFNSNNFYDRNALYLDGKLVCRYRDGERRQVTVTLKAGYVPIQSIGTTEARGSVHVRWIPPGATELTDISPNLLFHQPLRK